MQPRYIGSMCEFYKILSDNISPEEVVKDGLSGILFLTFEVDTFGHAFGFSTSGNMGRRGRKELSVAAEFLPNVWIPATRHGKKYKSKLTVPVVFIEAKDTSTLIPGKNSDIETPVSKMLDTIIITLSYKDNLKLSDSQKLVGKWQDEESTFILKTDGQMFTYWNNGGKESGLWDLHNGMLRFFNKPKKVIFAYKVLKLTSTNLNYERLYDVSFIPTFSYNTYGKQINYHAQKIAEE